jgi:outer membrane protein TolC
LLSPTLSLAENINLSLSDALKRSFAYSKSLKASESALRQAEENYKKARSALFPVLNLVGSGYTQQNPQTSSSSSTTNLSAGAVSAPATSSGTQSYSASLQLIQPLYAGGALRSGLDYYQAQIGIAKQNLFIARQTLSSQVVTAFYNLEEAQRLNDVSVENRAKLKAFFGITSGYAKIGRNRLIDKIQAQVNYQLSLVDTDKTFSNKNINLLNLKTLIGDDSQANFYIPEDHLSKLNVSIPTKEEAILHAFEKNPLMKLAQLQEVTVNASEGIDMALDNPTLNLVGGAGYTSSDISTLFTQPGQNYRVGLVLTVPLFSGLSSVYKKQSYNEQIFQSKRNEEVVADNLKLQIQTAIENISTFKEEFVMASDTVKESRKGLDIANSGFQKGIISNLDVINIQTTNYNAEKLLLSSQSGFLLGVLGLEQAMGTDIENNYSH